jgi:hypothetical protein
MGIHMFHMLYNHLGISRRNPPPRPVIHNNHNLDRVEVSTLNVHPVYVSGSHREQAMKPHRVPHARPKRYI